VVYASSTSALATGSALSFNGTNLGLGYTANARGGVVMTSTNNSGTSEQGGYQVTNGNGVGLFAGVNGAAYTTGGIGNANNAVLYSIGNSDLVFGRDTTEQMRLTSTSLYTASGINVGIGTSLPQNKLVVSNSGAEGIEFDPTAISNAVYSLFIKRSTTTFIDDIRRASSYQWRDSAGNEKMRLDSSGNLLVGTTSAAAGSGSTVYNSANSTWTWRVESAANSAPNGTLIRFSGAAPNNGGNEFLYCQDTSAQRMAVLSNGGLANYSANDVNLSDRREKTNFAPAKSYLDVICAIPVQTFNYIDQNLETDGGLTLGVVAQDVQAVAPELVMEKNWASKDEVPKMRLSIYQTDLQYALMKCIQEQQAMIESLKARLDAANL
jgi:hypothetical protein